MIASQAAESFSNRFGGKPAIVVQAPGRVNLIGEHTDYNEGFVFPMAIQRGIAIAARPTSGPTRIISAQQEEEVSFDLRAVEPGSIGGWGRFPAGVAWALRECGFERAPNLEAFIVSDLPTGAGVSSSAALEVAFAAIWSHFAGLDLGLEELARIGQKAENDFVGMRCGIMDQFASAAGKAGAALFVDMRSLDVRYAKVPEGIAVVLCDTQARHDLATSAYNDRRAECESAAASLGVAALRDATLDDLLAKQDDMDPIAFRRARHVITENTRCQSFFWALEDNNELRIGLLMRASHESLREDFECTSRELDEMAEACWVAPGCIGARMTGGGFGGSCVALVREPSLEVFQRSVANRYTARTELQPEFLVCQAADGVHLFVP